MKQKLLDQIKAELEADEHAAAEAILNMMAEWKAERRYRADAWERAKEVPSERMFFTWEALAVLIQNSIAHGNPQTLCVMAGAGLEDANYHTEAASVREIAGWG